MATPAEYFDSYETVGMKEDISDLIYNIAAVETPVLSAISVGKTTQRTHFWQLDVLPTVDGTTGVAIEGHDASLTALVPTLLRGNHTQINQIAFGVTGSQEESSKYGRDGELAYQAARLSRWLKRQTEMGLIGLNQAAVVGDGTVTARKTASLSAWLTSNVSRGALGANPTLSGGIPNAGATDGTLRAFALSQVDDVMQLAYTNGGHPTLMVCGPKQRKLFSAADGIAPRRVDATERRTFGVSDLYVSNFGELVVVTTRHIRNRTGGGDTADCEIYGIDPDLIAINYFRSWQQFDLAKIGDSFRRQMLVEWMLEVRNEAGHFVIADLD